MGSKCRTIEKLVLGVLILLNVFVWPQWLGVNGWIAFFGILMVLGAVIKLIWPGNCSRAECCPTTMEQPMAKPKKRVTRKRKR